MNLERWSLRLWWIQRMLNRQQPLDVELLQRCLQSVAFSKKPEQIESWQVQRIYSQSTSETKCWSSFLVSWNTFFDGFWLMVLVLVCFPVASLFSRCFLAGQGSIHSFCYLSRYALARNIWMEILLKLSAVALVTLIRSSAQWSSREIVPRSYSGHSRHRILGTTVLAAANQQTPMHLPRMFISNSCRLCLQ